MRIAKTLWTLVPLLVPGSFASAQQASEVGGPTAGRTLWLRADTGVVRGPSSLVSRWRDQSGAGHDLIQPDASRAPLWSAHGMSGRPALHFDGDDLLTRPDGMPTGDYTKVAVVSLEDFGSNNNVLSGTNVHAVFYGGTDRARMYHGGTFVTSSAPTVLGQPTILIATYDAVSGQGVLHQDGQQVGTGSAGPSSDASLEVGSFAGANHLRGWISELMVYDRVLDATERASLEHSLAARFQPVPAAPEVQFSAMPRDAQLLQRDGSDQAEVQVTGEVHSAGYDTIGLELRRDGSPLQVVEAPLAYTGGVAAFALTDGIVAGLHSYELRVYLLAGADRTDVAARANLVCGDALLLVGQSNTVAGDYHGELLGNQSRSKWIRSFGSGVVSPDAAYDLHWGLADGEAFNAHATTGSWGLRMAELLVAREQVPIALVNGAVGGTAIALHLRNDAQPEDLTTIYGRLLFRARQAGLAGGARALLWYQGESDGENIAAYEISFQTLYDAWHEDYPALEKLYVFQIRKGCGVTASGVREVLRLLPDQYPDIEVMSTTGAPAHDGCHYLYAGYRELGDRIARLVSRDLYGSTDTQEIDPPNIDTAAYQGPANDSIVLSFRDPDDALVWQAGSEQDFLFDDATTVVSGAVSGNTIVLQLAAPSTATTITWDGHAFDGPWIQNARGVGALTFFDVPIVP